MKKLFGASLFILVFSLSVFPKNYYEMSFKIIPTAEKVIFESYSTSTMSGIRALLNSQIDSVSIYFSEIDTEKKGSIHILSRFSKTFFLKSDIVPSVTLSNGLYFISCVGIFSREINKQFFSESILQSDAIKMEVKGNKSVTFYLNKLVDGCHIFANIVFKRDNRLVDVQEIISDKGILLTRDVIGGKYDVRRLKIPTDNFRIAINDTVSDRCSSLSGFHEIVFDISQMNKNNQYVVEFGKSPKLSRR